MRFFCIEVQYHIFGPTKTKDKGENIFLVIISNEKTRTISKGILKTKILIHLGTLCLLDKKTTKQGQRKLHTLKAKLVVH